MTAAHPTPAAAVVDRRVSTDGATAESAGGGERVTGRGTLYVLLTVVAGAAAMLSFAALRDLALLCGFGPALAWLLPVVVDAGAAAGSLVWLGARTGEPARRFARRLALGLLALSVAANALGHGLAAFVLAPPWWVVVLLSGIAPAVLGAMVHLAVLVGRPHRRVADHAPATVDTDGRPSEQGEAATEPDAHAPWTRDPLPPAATRLAGDRTTTAAEDEQAAAEPGLAAPEDTDRAAALIAAGAGRRRLSRELGVTEYEARRLLERARPTGVDSETTPVTAGVTRMTTGYLIVFNAVAFVAVVLAWRRRAWLVASGLAVFALWPLSQLVERIPLWLLVALGLLAAVLAWHRFSRTSATVTRWGARTRRKSGVASTFDIARVGSGAAMRRKAATVRPSLSPATRRARWWQLLALPTAEVGLQLCRVGLLRVWISVEDVLVVFGGPRTGKTQ